MQPLPLPIPSSRSPCLPPAFSQSQAQSPSEAGQCQKCGPFDSDGKLRRGLKQRGKTTRDGTHGVRIYQCQDCNALWRLTFDTSTKQVKEEPVLILITNETVQ